MGMRSRYLLVTGLVCVVAVVDLYRSHGEKPDVVKPMAPAPAHNEEFSSAPYYHLLKDHIRRAPWPDNRRWLNTMDPYGYIGSREARSGVIHWDKSWFDEELMRVDIWAWLAHDQDCEDAVSEPAIPMYGDEPLADDYSERVLAHLHSSLTLTDEKFAEAGVDHHGLLQHTQPGIHGVVIEDPMSWSAESRMHDLFGDLPCGDEITTWQEHSLDSKDNEAVLELFEELREEVARLKSELEANHTGRSKRTKRK